MIWRTQYNVPEVYPAESRDFQLLGRLLDSVINGVKFNIDAIAQLSNTNNIMTSLLPLLQEKLGFFSDKEFTDKELRYILDAFPTIIKYKGSKKAIKEAVNVFLRLYCIDTHNTSAQITIGDEDQSTSIYDELAKYNIYIDIESTPRDTKVLDEIFKYILPPGYCVVYRFYTSFETNVTENIIYTDKVNITMRNTEDNNFRPTKDEVNLTTEQQRVVGTVGMIEVDGEVKE